MFAISAAMLCDLFVCIAAIRSDVSSSGSIKQAINVDLVIYRTQHKSKVVSTIRGRKEGSIHKVVHIDFGGAMH